MGLQPSGSRKAAAAAAAAAGAALRPVGRREAWLGEASFREANQPLLEAYLLRRLLRACAAQVRLNPNPNPGP